ncbi:MAG: 1-acyl-sn-glycerol-3-phosphate acyltransferase [Nitrospinota bacterium]|nr:1-acyl-sn-glycerol-3-phosphate acyltransferase [Nitrospinota bacterium]
MIVFLQNLFRFIVFFFVDFFYRLVFRSYVIGTENIPRNGGALIAPNHISGWDVFIVPYFALNRFSSRQMWAPAKEELFSFPPMGWVLHILRAFPVRRKKSDYASRDRTAEITRDHLVMIFPEGTRSKNGKLGRGRPGVGKIIWDSRVPVIPTLVINTNYCVIPGLFMLNFFQKLYVVYGKPLDFSRFWGREDTKETSQEVADYLMKEIARMKEEYKHLDSTHEWIKRRVEAKYRRYEEKIKMMDDADSGG